MRLQVAFVGARRLRQPLLKRLSARMVRLLFLLTPFPLLLALER